MTRPTLTLLAVGLFVLPGAGQDQSTWANKFFTGKGANAPPVIVHDFGTLPKGTVRTHRFKMTNIYSVPMQVTEPRPSCGCVEVTGYSAKLNPLEPGFIDVKIDTSRVDGRKEVRLPVYFEGKDPKTNEAFWSWAHLEVRAVSRGDIAINPGVVDFKVVPAGQASEQTVTITYTGGQGNWKIEEVGSKKELFDVKVQPVRLAGARAAYQLTATLKATAPAGQFDEIFQLKTNDRNAPVLNLNVSGQVQAALSVVPQDRHKFGRVAVGERVTKSIIVRGDKLFVVKAVEGQEDGVRATMIPNPPNKSQPLTIEFAPAAVGTVKKTLTIKTDTGESVAFTVEGEGVAADAKAEKKP